MYTPEEIAEAGERVRAEREEQGLPEIPEDIAALANLARAPLAR